MANSQKNATLQYPHCFGLHWCGEKMPQVKARCSPVFENTFYFSNTFDLPCICFLFFITNVYTFGGFVFQLYPLVVIDYARDWGAEIKVDTENVVRGLYNDRPGCISYTVIDEWHAEMRLWSKAMQHQPILWWCDMCRSIVGQRMFLSVCPLLRISVETGDLNACCLWQ